ncbi:MAG: PepSY domain-containing protein [Oligoflexia bacterium]|nr:PepSY domain-containing protein [Oligoflexia bacterium]
MRKFLLTSSILTALIAIPALAQEAKPTETRMSPADRGKMATLHENLATCLRSNRPLNECRTEMRRNCQEMMGKAGCPMAMGMGMMDKRHGDMGGMMGGEMSGGEVALEPPKNIISMDKAESIALKKYPGTLKSSELEQQNRRWIYSFNVLGSDRSLHEVWVDARSGIILRHSLDSKAEG